MVSFGDTKCSGLNDPPKMVYRSTDKRVDKYTEKPYNLELDKAHKKVLEEFKKEYGITWKEIT